MVGPVAWIVRASRGVAREAESLMERAQRLDVRVSDDLFHREERPSAKGLSVQWLGTAGFRLVADGHHLWIDPHLSRHSLVEVLRGPLAPKHSRIRAVVDRVDAVVIGHSHWDHAVDLPFIAREHGARVYGSEDTLNICRGQAVAESRLTQMHSGESYREGPFTITPIRSTHASILAGRVPLPGRISAPLPGPARASDYRAGEVFGLHIQTPTRSVFHLGSAELLEANLGDLRADVVLCCTVGRQQTTRYVDRVIDSLAPSLVIASHWDQFWRPIEASPLQVPGNDLRGFAREIQAHPRAPELRVLPPLGWTRLA